jgi:hypothetical protein
VQQVVVEQVVVDQMEVEVVEQLILAVAVELEQVMYLRVEVAALV